MLPSVTINDTSMPSSKEHHPSQMGSKLDDKRKYYTQPEHTVIMIAWTREPSGYNFISSH